MAVEAPLTDLTVMVFPLKSKLTFPVPVYVPLDTRTVSPSTVASIPACIVGCSSGTETVAACNQ